MGFAGKVMEEVSGIQIYYIIGILIFIVLFFVILVRTILMSKTDLLTFKNSVFESDELNTIPEQHRKN